MTVAGIVRLFGTPNPERRYRYSLKMDTRTIEQQFFGFIWDNCTHVDAGSMYRRAKDNGRTTESYANFYSAMCDNTDDYSEINGRLYHKDDAESAKEGFVDALKDANASEEEIEEAESITI